jgi:hypothetical protein
MIRKQYSAIIVFLLLGIGIISCKLDIEKEKPQFIAEINSPKEIKDLNSPCFGIKKNSLDNQANLLASNKIKFYNIYDSVTLTKELIESTELNQFGNPVQIVSYENGNLIRISIYKYDNIGNNYESSILNPDNTINTSFYFSYNKKGNLVESFQITKGEKHNIEKSEFNESNQKIEVYFKRKSTDPFHLSNRFSYCLNGEIATHERFSDDEKLIESIRVNKDSNANSVQTISVDSNGKVDIGTITNYECDSIGQIISKYTPKYFSMNINGKTTIKDISERIKYKYNEKGILIGSSHFSGETLEKFKTYEYK